MSVLCLYKGKDELCSRNWMWSQSWKPFSSCESNNFAVSLTSKLIQVLRGAARRQKRKEGVIFCFYFFSLMRQRWRLLLTEAPLFGAQKRAARRAKGPLLGEGGGVQQSLYSAVWTWPEQQLVIKLTSQQAPALAPASHIIVVHWGGNPFFRGYQVKKQGWQRLIPAAVASMDGQSRRATALVLCLKGRPFNRWQPWTTETDSLFVFDVVPLVIFSPRTAVGGGGGSGPPQSPWSPGSQLSGWNLVRVCWQLSKIKICAAARLFSFTLQISWNAGGFN